MSGAAHDYVRACTHPKVKGGTRDLFDAIAHFVPEGETTTRSVGMEALATRARLHRRTVVKRLADLVEVGEVRVIDGGLGRIARYTIVHLDGAPPIVAQSLPLRADLQPVERRPRTDDRIRDLFDPDGVRSNTEEPVIEPVLIDHRLPPNLWRSITGWVAYLWRSITGWRSDGEKPVLIDHRLATEPVIDPCVLNTARDVLPLKETTTTTAPRDGPTQLTAVQSPPRGSPPCRYFATRHAWCAGRVHVPMPFHVEERRKLSRGPEETDADLDARLFACYARILAAVPDYEPILDRNEFEFWKRVMRAAPSHTIPTARPAAASAARRPDVLNTRPCPHHPPCADGDTDACVERSIAECRVEPGRQTG